MLQTCLPINCRLRWNSIISKAVSIFTKQPYTTLQLFHTIKCTYNYMLFNNIRSYTCNKTSILQKKIYLFAFTTHHNAQKRNSSKDILCTTIPIYWTHLKHTTHRTSNQVWITCPCQWANLWVCPSTDLKNASNVFLYGLQSYQHCGIKTLTVLVTTIDALQNFETG